MRKRLPHFQSILQVYAVIAVLCAGWTITAFLWKLSAWLLILNLGEIFTLFAYAMAANFLESLIVLSILLTLCVWLPESHLRDDFEARGTLMSIGLIGALMAFVGSEMQFGFESGPLLLIPPFAVLLLTGFFLFHSSSSPRVRSAARWLSDRVIVFLFILVPLFTVGSVYVIVRNLL